MKKIYLIIAREFSERVRKKSFIIVTLLMPLLMIAIMVAPSLMMLYSTSDQKQVVVIDRSGEIAPQLQSTAEVLFIPEEGMTKAEACRNFNEESGIFGILYIGSDVEARDSVQLITNASSSMIIEESIATQISGIIEHKKLLRINNFTFFFAVNRNAYEGASVTGCFDAQVVALSFEVIGDVAAVEGESLSCY